MQNVSRRLRAPRWGRIGRRGVVAGALAAAVIASNTIAIPHEARGATPKKASDLPALASSPVAPPAPEVPKGDFSNPPSLSATGQPKPPKAGRFDAATSTQVDGETTPTKRVYASTSTTSGGVMHTATVYGPQR